MDPDPHSSGSNDEPPDDDDLDQTFDSVSESSPADDLDTTFDTQDQHAPPNSRQLDDTANSIEMTVDAGAAAPMFPERNQAPLPDQIDIDETFPSQAIPPSVAEKGHANATKSSFVESDDGAISTRRGRETVSPIDATLEGSPSCAGSGSNDDDLLVTPSVDAPKLPAQIGRYEIRRLLGEGTFGKVYEARDPQLDRIVAIKVAKSISGKTQIERFLREARAAAQLRHPSIIPVYEYGLVEGENIIVYEFVAGETLKSYLKRNKPLTADESVAIVQQIAEGLNYAHEQGIIHRDMKPDNVLIDPAGHPHIADFGCARSIEDNTNLTIDGSILGTPMYMSPEQAGGRSNLADARTDIWSLGVMLYEMVGGEKPFAGNLSQLLFSICNKDPAPLRKIRPDAPLDIETICSKCLAREVDHRFSSAKFLADELGRFQRGEPIESRRVGTIQRTWMWAKRNQAVASLISAVVITMLIGTIVSSAFAIEAYWEKQKRANAQLNMLTKAESSALPGIFESLTPFRGTILPKLYDRLANSQTTSDDRRRLRMAIVELEQDPVLRDQYADELVEDLLVAEPDDFLVTRNCLDYRKLDLTGRLWDVAQDVGESNSSERRFRAAAALAQFDRGSPHWTAVAPDVAGQLTSFNEIDASKWLRALLPIRNSLKSTLRSAFTQREDDSDNTPERSAAILASMFEDDIEFVVGLVALATPQQLPYLTTALEVNRADALTSLRASLKNPGLAAATVLDPAIQRSNLVTALVQLKDPAQWGQFATGPDRSVATELIERLGPASTPFEILAAQIRDRNSISANVLAGMLLSLGQYKENQILKSQKHELKSDLLEIFVNHPDSHVHSSARWLLQRWGFQGAMLASENGLRRAQPDPKMNWHVDLAGNTFALFGPVDSFEMGLSETMVTGTDLQLADVTGEPMHLRSIPRRFGICIYEVTNRDFAEFESEFVAGYSKQNEQVEAEIAGLPDLPPSADEKSLAQRAEKVKQLNIQIQKNKIRAKEADRRRKRRLNLNDELPVGDVDFFKSLAYCRWLSDQQDLACGLPLVADLLNVYLRFPEEDFSIQQENLDRPGYRLPTAAEWEYASRGSSQTIFPFGRSPQRAGSYAWYASNSDTKLHPVGQLKPGHTGLFDVLGNVSEWCLDWYDPGLPELESPGIYVDFGREFRDRRRILREFRGGSFMDEVLDVRSTKRFSMAPNMGQPRVGFRLARTYESSVPANDSNPELQPK